MSLEIDEEGNRFWRDDDNLFHREDGPAIECVDGSKEWWIDGAPHRTDGPAVDHANNLYEWWINDEKVAASFGMLSAGLTTRADGTLIYYCR